MYLVEHYSREAVECAYNTAVLMGVKPTILALEKFIKDKKELNDSGVQQETTKAPSGFSRGPDSFK